MSEAREMLEYTVETISIPREYAGILGTILMKFYNGVFGCREGYWKER